MKKSLILINKSYLHIKNTLIYSIIHTPVILFVIVAFFGLYGFALYRFSSAIRQEITTSLESLFEANYITSLLFVLLVILVLISFIQFISLKRKDEPSVFPLLRSDIVLSQNIMLFFPTLLITMPFASIIIFQYQDALNLGIIHYLYAMIAFVLMYLTGFLLIVLIIEGSKSLSTILYKYLRLPMGAIKYITIAFIFYLLIRFFEVPLIDRYINQNIVQLIDNYMKTQFVLLIYLLLLNCVLFLIIRLISKVEPRLLDPHIFTYFQSKKVPTLKYHRGFILQLWYQFVLIIRQPAFYTNALLSILSIVAFKYTTNFLSAFQQITFFGFILITSSLYLVSSYGKDGEVKRQLIVSPIRKLTYNMSEFTVTFGLYFLLLFVYFILFHAHWYGAHIDLFQYFRPFELLFLVLNLYFLSMFLGKLLKPIEKSDNYIYVFVNFCQFIMIFLSIYLMQYLNMYGILFSLIAWVMLLITLWLYPIQEVIE